MATFQARKPALVSRKSAEQDEQPASAFQSDYGQSRYHASTSQSRSALDPSHPPSSLQRDVYDESAGQDPRWIVFDKPSTDSHRRPIGTPQPIVTSPPKSSRVDREHSSSSSSSTTWQLIGDQRPAFLATRARASSGDDVDSQDGHSDTAELLTADTTLSFPSLPTHDGSGIFLSAPPRSADSTSSRQSSANESELPSFYASAAGLTASTGGSTSWTPAATRTSRANRHQIGHSAGLLSANDDDSDLLSSERERALDTLSLSSFDDITSDHVPHDPRHRETILSGSSWALTESALSQIPDALSLSASVQDQRVYYTSDDSADSEEEDLLARTPQAQSAGISALRRDRRGRRAAYRNRHAHPARDSVKTSDAEQSEATRAHRLDRLHYPTPPPEEELEMSRSQASRAAAKRRHKRSGISDKGSKRSHSSAAENKPASVPIATPSVASTRKAKFSLGDVVNNMLDIDQDTRLLLRSANPESETPTPTGPRRSPSRRRVSESYSARQSLSSHIERERPSDRSHGVARLSSWATAELGDYSGYAVGYALDEDAEMDSGEETEIEDQPGRVQPAIVLSESDSPTAVHRSHSLVSLPRHIIDSLYASLPSSMLTSREVESDSTHSGGHTSPLKRSASFTSAGRPAASQAEPDDLESAVLFWKRVLRRFRPF
ncbi:uncharacterized protein L969DRAFT_18906 [Mixia osmundae IAM 14324]|uniref:uncharacterized protein n=1 Tax=Mixia osmundae (strain CBS 9802 / IAM 14324 / JCM 22182 / KY 12970) TaxID=764103 RepID=UPI0004A55A1B|nr:uncharacterized protein L969DRAFT_91154 [Mixia osmundae IAM 14324]XP_014566407.1 uncharacterized protein L969DRAFT_18906 [Mixia osmundae IAM 14324]KEI36161.1 hypothetical protein L969DRAFT_91154 [Mixia osmundae IAM 14324]KEI38129.1 hypothetical protein L969DRAFT_18906 [Mixia osmundae IAM 14324]